MQNLRILIILFLFISNHGYSQDYTDFIKKNPENKHTLKPKEQRFIFTSVLPATKLKEDIETVDVSMIRNHFLGEEVAKRIFLFENTYTYESKAAPGAFSGRKVIHKPIIYDTIYQIEKHLKKAVRKGNLDDKNASYEFCKYLELALFLLHEETSNFENALKHADSATGAITIFNNVEIQYN